MLSYIESHLWGKFSHGAYGQPDRGELLGRGFESEQRSTGIS